jgi:hypothetical protein
MVNVTCAQNPDPLVILSQHGVALGQHAVVEVELAFDVVAGSIADARAILPALIGQLGKRRHRRGFLWSEQKPDQTPQRGYVSEPTLYFEDRGSGVKIKCYLRHEKGS